MGVQTMTDAHDHYYEQARAMLWELNAHVCREDDDGLCFKCMGILTDGLAAAAQPAWTTEKPTKGGLYWFRVQCGGQWCDPAIIWFDGINFVRHFMGTISEAYLCNMTGQFAGPLQPPKEKT